MDRVCEGHSPLIITRKASPSVVMISLDDYEAGPQPLSASPYPDPWAAIVASIVQVRVRPSAEGSIREIWLDVLDHASAG